MRVLLIAEKFLNPSGPNTILRMNFNDVLHGRRSIRRYKNDPIPGDVVETLLESAEAAPSAGNLRSRKYVVITSPLMRRVLAEAAFSQSQVQTAPLLIVVCADVGRSCSRYGDRGSLFAIQDADAATMCILLAAHELGLGACWNGAFDDALVREALGMGKEILPTAIISLGWPDETPAPPDRRNGREVVNWIEKP
jgi:nitroreductase